MKRNSNQSVFAVSMLHSLQGMFLQLHEIISNQPAKTNTVQVLTLQAAHNENKHKEA